MKQGYYKVLEDYNKGVLTVTAIEKIIALCRQNNILTSVDPKRKNFFAYKHADIFKPNLHEAKEGLNIIGDEVSEALLSNIHQTLFEKLQHGISFITLSEKGVFYQSQNEKALIPTHIRSIADVSGAGDTVIAVASVIYAATKDKLLMAEIANIAGGLVCEAVGTVAIDKQKLLQECKQLLV
jgi:rfaE bifunctional protein kinase chain/domain